MRNLREEHTALEEVDIRGWKIDKKAANSPGQKSMNNTIRYIQIENKAL